MRTVFGLSTLVVMVLASCAIAQVGTYSQDFEGLDIAGSTSLSDDGWVVSGIVLDGSMGFKFFYGNFPAPNHDVAFSRIATGEGGPAQGSKYLNTFSDYNCCDLDELPTQQQGHGDNGRAPDDFVVSNILQQRTISAVDIGKTMTFKFDATLPSDGFQLAPPSTGNAFIRTINNVDFSTSAEVILDVQTDMMLTMGTWTTHEISFDITPALENHFFQFGFQNTSQQFGPTGVFFDNISLVPEPSGFVLGMATIFLGLTRRRR